MSDFLDILSCPKRVNDFKMLLAECEHSATENRVLQAATRVTVRLHKFDQSWTNKPGKEGRRERRTLLLNKTLAADLKRCSPLLVRQGKQECLGRLEGHIQCLKADRHVTTNAQLVSPVYSVLYLLLEQKHKEGRKTRARPSTTAFATANTAAGCKKAEQTYAQYGDVENAVTQEQTSPVQQDEISVTIVIDTNTLMHHRELFRTLFGDYDFGDRVTVFVPWVLHLELDDLKKPRGDAVARRRALSAREAIRYLRSRKECRRQQWTMQSVSQWQTAKCLFEAQCRDDEVLQAALQCQNAAGHRERVILWTQDVVLQNKGAANAISVCNAETLLLSVRKATDGACAR